MSARDELAKLLAVTRYPHIGDAWDERDDRSPAKHFSYKEADAILAAGYRKPQAITTAEEIRELPALTIVVYDDTSTGGLLQTYVVPDDGTVMFKDCGEFHLMTFGGDYIDAKDMPLPLTAVYEVGA